MNSTDSVRYIFLHSLFDERKCAQCFSFELKCEFEKRGKILERPDYYGTGEADGDFCQIDMDSIRKDIERFCSYGNCVLIGLRFGAAMIWDYLRCHPDNISGGILIDPVYNLNEYVEYLYRKQRIKDILTGFKDVTQEEGQYVNIEGYKTQRRFLGQLEDYGAVSFEACDKIPVTVISNGDCVKKDIAAKMTTLKYEPFWERIPPQDHSHLVAAIVWKACAI